MTLHVAGLWRYPVKSLAGESLTVATLTPEGIPGDRMVHVCGPESVRTARRHHRPLGLRVTPGSDSRPRIVEGIAVTSWPGAHPHVAGTLTRLDALRDRCTMTTVDPDTFERDPEVLKEIIRRFGGRRALDADVVRGGMVRIGDDALIEEHASDRSVIVRR